MTLSYVSEPFILSRDHCACAVTPLRCVGRALAATHHPMHVHTPRSCLSHHDCTWPHCMLTPAYDLPTMPAAACAAIALKDGLWGWSHSAARRDRYMDPAATAELLPRPPAPWEWMNPKIPSFNFSASGLVAAGMCVAYMVTGMTGLEQYCLPLTPGAVYKSSDVVLKQRVWQMWGYSRVTMRQ